ncbi:hypothetical protein CHARACLAT_017030 [Characodon lateralis]|uniref:Uncharacterized protein n=1 Tax=Characodon lateralis TaxID=208331 RepID=A0ABU7D195_9TELE|nr:hypothetical protein [Characodon lateralis]
MSSKAKKAPPFLKRFLHPLPCKRSHSCRPQNITGSKIQVFCGPEWRHLIGREPINHAFSRTPPPIQPLASLFQCVYYTAEHKGRHSSSHALNPLRKPIFSCICKEISKRSTCPRESHREQKEEKRRSPRGDQLGYQRNLLHPSQNQR